jgi:hypothetical protein
MCITHFYKMKNCYTYAFLTKEHFRNKSPELTIYFEFRQGEKRNPSSAKVSIFNAAGAQKRQSKRGSYFGIVPNYG